MAHGGNKPGRLTLCGWLWRDCKQSWMIITFFVLLMTVVTGVLAVQLYFELGTLVQTGPPGARYLRLDPYFMTLIQTARWHVSLWFLVMGLPASLAVSIIYTLAIGLASTVLWIKDRVVWWLNQEFAAWESAARVSLERSLRAIILKSILVLGIFSAFMLVFVLVFDGTQETLVAALFLLGLLMIASIVGMFALWEARAWEQAKLPSHLLPVAARWIAVDAGLAIFMFATLGTSVIVAMLAVLTSIYQWILSRVQMSLLSTATYIAEHSQEFSFEQWLSRTQHDIDSFRLSLGDIATEPWGVIGMFSLVGIFLGFSVAVPLLYQGFPKWPKRLRRLVSGALVSTAMFVLLKITERLVEHVVAVSVGQFLVATCLVVGFMWVLTRYLDIIATRLPWVCANSQCDSKNSWQAKFCDQCGYPRC